MQFSAGRHMPMNHFAVRRYTDQHVLSLMISITPPQTRDRHEFELTHTRVGKEKGHLACFEVEDFDLAVCAATGNVLIVLVESDTEDF